MANVTIANSDPRQADDSARVSIWIDGDEQMFVEEYSIDQDVLNVGDPFRVVIPNIDGRLAGRFSVGNLCKLYMESPHVENTGKVQKTVGRVTTIDGETNAQNGSTLSIGGADLGWHLRECHADIWKQIPGGITFADLVSRTIGDERLADWGIQGIEFNNLRNKRINQGRAGVERWIARAESGDRVFIPPMQVEPGQCAAEFLIEFARRAFRLVNVSSDGVIQFFEPDDDGDAEYSLRLYKSDSENRNKGNVKSARASWSIDGLYTKTVCVGSVVQLSRIVAANQMNPNRGKFRGSFTNTGSLPFYRPFYFADGDQLNREMANRRSEWKWRRGRFDSFTATYTVKGHTQGGKFWVPDSCVDLVDEIHGLRGKYYISAVRYDRTNQGGTSTTLTVKETGMFSA